MAHLRRYTVWFVLAIMAMLAILPATAGAAGKQVVYVLHIDKWQQIDPGLAAVVQRGFSEAEADPNAVAMALLIDTPGGEVQSAVMMKDRILSSKLRTVALVEGAALSAGALIATAAEQLYMHPGSSIGAAEPRSMGSTERADYKVVSAVVSQFRSTAEERGRDADVAQAMVDVEHKVPGQKTTLLTLTTAQAVEQRYASGTAVDLADALAQAGITDYTMIDIWPTPSEAVGRILTTPWVAILLLIVGVVAIGVEFMKPGVTVPALIGIVSLGLFFLGNVLVGTAGWVEITLALIGILLLVVEAFMPGFGIFGIGGIVAMAASIYLSVPDSSRALSYLMFASLAFLVALVGIVRAISRRGLGKALTLDGDESGYLPSPDRSGLVGVEGKALTVLRPAGTAQFGAEKVDVVAEGEYLPAGTPITVIRVDGTRVVVRSLVD